MIKILILAFFAILAIMLAPIGIPVMLVGLACVWCLGTNR